MILDIIQYGPYGDENAKERAKTLPTALQEQLVWNDDIYSGWNSLMIPSDNAEAIAELEKHIRLWPNPEYNKTRVICATDDELDVIPFYDAPTPDTVTEYGEDYIVAETKGPCSGWCRFGGSIDSHVQLLTEKMLEFDFVRVKYLHQPFCDLLISDRFKNIFEAANVHGLEYLYQCDLSEPLRELVPKGEEPWICRIKNRIFTHVDELTVFKWNCEKHKVMTPSYQRLNARRCRNDIGEADFSLDVGFLCKGEKYYHSIWFNIIITSRVMSLLLKNNASQLPLNRPFKSHLEPAYVADC